ncbi:MAG: hypothetical protein ACRDD7_06665 [Peptostreptococcaceae bacterium]
MGLLREELKKQNRAIYGKYIINQPNDEQYNIIKEMFSRNATIDGGLSVNGTIDEEMLRYMFKNLTNVGEEIDEISNDELYHLIKNGTRDFKRTIKELKEVVIEIIEDIQDEQYNAINILNSYSSVLNASTEMESVKKKMNKLLKKQGLNINFDELIEASKNPEQIQEILKEKDKSLKVNKKKKK